MRDITDAHIHLVPGVDDGARDIEEAIEEIKVEVACGVNRIIVTPHSSAFDYKQLCR